MDLQQYLIENKEASWLEINSFLESQFNSINPNTLHFHLKSLMEANLVSHSGNDEGAMYRTNEIPSYIIEGLEEIIKKHLN